MTFEGAVGRSALRGVCARGGWAAGVGGGRKAAEIVGRWAACIEGEGGESAGRGATGAVYLCNRFGLPLCHCILSVVGSELARRLSIYILRRSCER